MSVHGKARSCQQIQLVLSSTKTQFDVNKKFSMKLPKF